MKKFCQSYKRILHQAEVARRDGTMVLLHPDTVEWLLGARTWLTTPPHLEDCSAVGNNRLSRPNRRHIPGITEYRALENGGIA